MKAGSAEHDLDKQRSITLACVNAQDMPIGVGCVDGKFRIRESGLSANRKDAGPAEPFMDPTLGESIEK